MQALSKFRQHSARTENNELQTDIMKLENLMTLELELTQKKKYLI